MHTVVVVPSFLLSINRHVALSLKTALASLLEKIGCRQSFSRLPPSRLSRLEKRPTTTTTTTTTTTKSRRDREAIFWVWSSRNSKYVCVSRGSHVHIGSTEAMSQPPFRMIFKVPVGRSSTDISRNVPTTRSPAVSLSKRYELHSSYRYPD